jgi:hypothetical protein
MCRSECRSPQSGHLGRRFRHRWTDPRWQVSIRRPEWTRTRRPAARDRLPRRSCICGQAAVAGRRSVPWNAGAGEPTTCWSVAVRVPRRYLGAGAGSGRWPRGLRDLVRESRMSARHRARYPRPTTPTAQLQLAGRESPRALPGAAGRFSGPGVAVSACDRTRLSVAARGRAALKSTLGST